MKKILLPLLALTLILGSCKKYEEGPALSFRSKKGRIAGEWKLVKNNTNGQDDVLTADDKDDVWKIEKDGSYEITDPGNSTQKGKWTFNDKKETVTFTDESGGFSLIATILKLKNNELWMEFDFAGDKTIQHYEQ